MAAEEAVIDEATELLQTLIRNECVNDGTRGSGGEDRGTGPFLGNNCHQMLPTRAP